MMVAIIALVFAVGGAAVAAPNITSTKKKKASHADKKQDLALIKDYLKKNKVPKAVHADSADAATTATTATSTPQATHADNADRATNADHSTASDKATEADHAKNSDAVSGRHVGAIFFATNSNSASPVTVFDRDGLTLKASCDTGSGITLTARTNKNNASLLISRSDSAADGEFGDLDTGSDNTIMDSAGTGDVVTNGNGNVAINFATPLTGATIITRTGGAIVSLSLQVWKSGGFAFSNACVLTGTAVSDPPTTGLVIGPIVR